MDVIHRFCPVNAFEFGAEESCKRNIFSDERCLYVPFLVLKERHFIGREKRSGKVIGP